MIAVHKHLRLDDRHQPCLLRKRRKPCQRVGVGVDAVLTGDPVTDGDHRSPLCEPRPQFVIFIQAIAQSIQTFRDFLIRRTCQGLRTFVHFDAGNDPLLSQDLYEGRTIVCLLADRLVKKNHAADELAYPRGGEQHLPVRPAAVFGGFDVDRFEPLLDGGVALVRREDSLAGGDDRVGDGVEI